MKKVMTSSLNRIDSHLHLFNLSFLLHELINIGWDVARGTYPKSKITELKTDQTQIAQEDIMPAVKLFSKWLLDLMEGSFLDAKDQYMVMTKEFKKVYGSNINYIIAPLMMDIYYLFAPPNSSALAPLNKNLAAEEVFKRDFENFIQELKVIFKKVPTEAFKSTEKAESTVEKIIDSLVLDFKNLTLPDHHPFPPNTKKSWGFVSNFHELIKLEAEYHGQVFPFLAVDPRRPGIMDLARKYVTPQGPFYGIKLYPRLGYKIQLNDFFTELFSFCIDNDLPITFHGSSGGMPPEMPIEPFKDWPCDSYGDPGEWEGILSDRRFNNLRLNIGHFGGPEGLKTYKEDLKTWQKSWTFHAIKLLSKYPNVYSDLSCYSDPENIQLAYEIMKDTQYSKIQSRILFGTDNPVVFLTALGDVTYESYYKSFQDAFKEDPALLEAIMITNPSQFLKFPV